MKFIFCIFILFKYAIIEYKFAIVKL